MVIGLLWYEPGVVHELRVGHEETLLKAVDLLLDQLLRRLYIFDRPWFCFEVVSPAGNLCKTAASSFVTTNRISLHDVFRSEEGVWPHAPYRIVLTSTLTNIGSPLACGCSLEKHEIRARVTNRCNTEQLFRSPSCMTTKCATRVESVLGEHGCSLVPTWSEGL